MADNYLAFDLGASSGRGIIGVLNEEKKLRIREVHRFANGPTEKDGSLYWDFNSICGEIKKGLKKAFTECSEIANIAVDTWGVDYILLKENGTPARNPYHYRDSRTADIPEKVYSIVPKEEIYASTGIQHMQLNTIFQLYAHKEKHPEDFENSTLLLIPDALTHFLCGKKACEYTEASTSHLLDAGKKNWNFELIEKIGLPKKIFPEIAMPCTIAGSLKKELIGELGLQAAEVIHAGSHDTASAVASVPAPKNKKWLYISCGTWALLGAELDNPFINENARKAGFTNEGGINGKIRFLTNIMGTWLFQECVRNWKEAGKEISYADMGPMASKAKALEFLINPNDSSFAAPCDMPENIRNYCASHGQGEPQNENALLRCIYDSLALCFRNKTEQLQELLNTEYECINIVGGGTQDSFLMQLTADCTGIPVVAGPVEATAAGNIMAQGMAEGRISSLEEARDIIKRSFEVREFMPKSDSRAAWNEAYCKFNSLTD